LRARAAAFALAATVLAAACAHTTKIPLASPTLQGSMRPEWGPPRPGDQAPPLVLPRIEGGTFDLASARGSWVFLHFTATWCPFCDSEASHLGEIAAAEPGVVVVLVDVEEPLDRFRAYAATHVPKSVVTVHDATGKVSATFAPPGAQPSFADRAEVVLASTMVIDPEGTIRLFVLPDSAHFDPSLADVVRELDRLRAGGEEPAAIAQKPAAAAGEDPQVPADGRVVEVSASYLKGATGDLVVRAKIRDGFHVMSDQPSKPEYVATKLALEPLAGVTYGAPTWPAPTMFGVAGDSIRTFVGTIEVHVPVTVDALSKPAPRTMHGKLHYQACTKSSCVFPRDEPFEVTIDGP
jgi:peroxiredoxin